MSDYLPKFLPGQQPTLVASATITGGQLVTAAGAVAADNSTTVVGVAGYDVVSGQLVTIYRDGIQRLVASATIAVGDPICAAAAGQIRKWLTGTDAPAAHIGTAWTAGAAAASIDVALFGV